MGLLDRIRGEGAPAESADDASSALVNRLGSIARRGGQLAGRVADGVKEATPKRLLRDAMDAQARENVGAAFFLSRESVEAEPGDPEADAFFWDVAIAYGEPGAAADSAARLVHHHAGHEAPELAAQYFRELVGACEPSLVEPSVLVRLLPELILALETAEAEEADASGDASEATVGASPAAHRAAIRHALSMCVHPENTALSPGLAMRVAEFARPFDSEVALEAAHRALAADDVHEAKRAKLVALIRELDPEAELDREEPLEVDEADLAAASIDLDDDDLDGAALGQGEQAGNALEALPLEVDALESAALETDAPAPKELENDAIEPPALEAEALEVDALEPPALQPELLDTDAFQPPALPPESPDTDALEPPALPPEVLEADELDSDEVDVDVLDASELEAEAPVLDGVEAEGLTSDAQATTDLDAAELDADAIVTSDLISVEPESEISTPGEVVAAIEITDAEADRIASFLEPSEDELEAVMVGDITDSQEVDVIDVLPVLDPIDEHDPSRNHPSRVESPAHQALSEDEIGRARARLDRALGSADAAESGETPPD